MARASISAIAPSPCGCSLLPSRASGACGISGLERSNSESCSNSSSSWAGLAASRFCSSSCDGSLVNWSKRLGGQKVRLYGEGGNYSFHKGTLQPARCNKMFVPGFGEKSPEAKAADTLHNFLTFIAVKIVLSQLQDYNREAYEDLMDFVDKVSLKDGDKFCAALMRESFRHKGLALRIMEVRSAYTNADFEWDNLQRICKKNMEDKNTRLMREFLVETSEYEQ